MTDAPTETSPGPTPAATPQHERLELLAYVVSSPSLSRRRRARLAETIAREALDAMPPAGPDPPADRRLPQARARVVKAALLVEPPQLILRRHTGRWVPSGDDDSARATERALAAMVPAARAAHALRHLEGLSPDETCELLHSVGVRDPETATALAAHAGPDARQMQAIEVPAGRPSRWRPVAAAAGVATILAGAAVPVVAGSGEEPDRRPGPAAPTTRTDVVPPAANTTAGQGGAGLGGATATDPAPGGGPAQAGERAAAEQRKLDRAIRRLANELLEQAEEQRAGG